MPEQEVLEVSGSILPHDLHPLWVDRVELAHIASHINSAPRASLGSTSPLALAEVALGKKKLELLGLSLVEPTRCALDPACLSSSGSNSGY